MLNVAPHENFPLYTVAESFVGSLFVVTLIYRIVYSVIIITIKINDLNNYLYLEFCQINFGLWTTEKIKMII